MTIKITATYYARFHIVYVKPYTDERRKRLDEAIRECCDLDAMDEERTVWFGHSKRVDGTFASTSLEAVEQAAAKLEAKLARMKIARLVPLEELLRNPHHETPPRPPRA
jgi:hypothetical protein